MSGQLKNLEEPVFEIKKMEYSLGEFNLMDPGGKFFEFNIVVCNPAILSLIEPAVGDE